MVMTVGGKYLDKGHHFYDNFFSSVALAETLLERNTTCCGTTRVNRKGWPADLKITKATRKDKRLQKGKAKMQQKGNMVATIWQDKRTIAVLSTCVQPVMGSAMRQNGRGEISFIISFCLYIICIQYIDKMIPFQNHKQPTKSLLVYCAGQRVPKAIPLPILTYNENMLGVDLHGQHRSYHPVRRSGRKW